MRIKRQHPHSSPRGAVARRLRPLAAASGLLAVAAVVVVPGAAQAGAEPVGTFSATQLADASDAVLAADVGGTAWAVDEETNSVVVSADETVSDAELAEITASAGALADAITVERTEGTLRPYRAGGGAIYASSWRCSLGFNVRSGDTFYFLTAGHCTEDAGDWYTDAAQANAIGPTADSSFPTNDYGLVEYTSSSVWRPGAVALYDGNGATRDITDAANATNGMRVQRSGSTTGLHDGTVTGLDYTVNYGGGDVVDGMIRTNVCAEPGDSGGALFSGSTAIGLTSGGSGDCTAGGTTYFQPVVEALNAYDVSVY